MSAVCCKCLDSKYQLFVDFVHFLHYVKIILYWYSLIGLEDAILVIVVDYVAII